MVDIHSDYLSKVFNPTSLKILADRCIERCVAIMLSNPFDAIAFTGISGASMAYILSYNLGVPLICVRKKNDDSHYTRSHYGHIKGRLEGNITAKSYLIVDDWIESGDTVKRIGATIREFNPQAKCAGMLAYQGSSWNPKANVGTWDKPEIIPVFLVKHDDLVHPESRIEQ